VCYAKAEAEAEAEAEADMPNDFFRWEEEGALSKLLRWLVLSFGGARVADCCMISPSLSDLQDAIVQQKKPTPLPWPACRVVQQIPSSAVQDW
jgi:hypothetical protein